MTVAVILAASPAIRRVGAAPAGLNPAQMRAWVRLTAARAVTAGLTPLDPAYLAAERSYEQLRRLNGDD